MVVVVVVVMMVVVVRVGLVWGGLRIVVRMEVGDGVELASRQSTPQLTAQRADREWVVALITTTRQQRRIARV